jgi:molybdopterin/thiamine biosynthesis adenylyltransferase
VLLFGLGDIGSRIALSLAQAGVSRLALLDMDIVEEGNLGQAAFLRKHVGRPKTRAMASLCAEVAPDIETREAMVDLNRLSDSELSEWCRDGDAALLGVDEPSALLRIHDALYGSMGTVSAGIHMDAASGHVVYTLPDQTPCLRCSLDVLDEDDIGQIRSNAAAPQDIARIANEAVVVLLALLGRGQPLAGSENLLFINNHRTEALGAGELRWLQTERQPDCPVCSGR